MPRAKKSARSKRVLWTSADLKSLRKSAGRKALGQISRDLKRTEAAVQRRASIEGISLRRRGT